MRKPFIGQPLPRFEDRRLLTGQGRFTDDIRLEGAVFAVFVRSPHPSARIVAVKTGAAAGMAGVLDVITAQVYRAEGGQPIRHLADPLDAIDVDRRAFGGWPGAVSHDIPHWPLAEDRVRYVGEPVVMVVAETAALAAEAAEAVEVDYDDLPGVTDARAALAEGAPVVDPLIPGNLAVWAELGNRAGVEAALARAAHVVQGVFPNQRIANAQMEPRAVVVDYDFESDTYLMIAGSQGAMRQRDTLARALGVARDRVQVVVPDVGGGFGPRTNLQSEQPVMAIAARRLHRPVRWTSTRSESFLTDLQARDLCVEARMGLDAAGRILAYDARITGNVGAYTVSFVPMANCSRILTTAYHVPVAAALIRGAMTHTVPTAPFRGAGRPEAHFAIERLLDMAARQIGLDGAEIRRRNLIAAGQLPYRTPSGLTYDSGDFAGNLEQVLQAADWTGFPARRAEAAARGRLAGIGVANYVESPVGALAEAIDLTVGPDGIAMRAGTQSTGQGHETSFVQVLADLLGVEPGQVRLMTGDTRLIDEGGGSHSDRSMRLVGELMVEASEALIGQAKAVLADRLGWVAPEILFQDKRFQTVGDNRSFGLLEVAGMAGELVARARIARRVPAHPTGAAVCEVEVDPETGQVQVTRYTTVDDVGQPINPLIVDGQTHGGILQGLGQALLEQVATDPDSGQVLTGSFMDYGVLRADRVPFYDVALVEDPTGSNALRVKGGGEGGITPALATTINAVLDALAPLGVTDIEMPASPGRVWQAIRQSGGLTG